MHRSGQSVLSLDAGLGFEINAGIFRQPGCMGGVRGHC